MRRKSIHGYKYNSAIIFHRQFQASSLILPRIILDRNWQEIIILFTFFPAKT